MKMTKVTVITDQRGEIVGTQDGHAKDHRPEKEGPRIRLTPGQNETVHEIELEVPDLAQPNADLTEYYAAVKQHLSQRKA